MIVILRERHIALLVLNFKAIAWEDDSYQWVYGDRLCFLNETQCIRAFSSIKVISSCWCKISYDACWLWDVRAGCHSATATLYSTFVRFRLYQQPSKRPYLVSKIIFISLSSAHSIIYDIVELATTTHFLPGLEVDNQARANLKGGDYRTQLSRQVTYCKLRWTKSFW